MAGKAAKRIYNSATVRLRVDREASEEIAGFENRLSGIESDVKVAQVDGRNEHRADVRYLASALHGVEKAARYLDGPAIISRSCRSAWSIYSIQLLGLGRRRVEAEFNGGQITSDAGPSSPTLPQELSDPYVRPPVNTTSTPPQPGKSPASCARQFTPGSAGRPNTSG